jgi:hypothetical protein
MPRSTEAKLRRRNRKKGDQDQAMDMLGKGDWEGDDGEDDDHDDDDDDDDDENKIKPTTTTKSSTEELIELFPMKNASAADTTLPKQNTATKKTMVSSKQANPAMKSSSNGVGIGGLFGGIKTTL